MESETKQQNSKLVFDGVTWAHIQNPDKDVLEALKDEYHLHPIHLQESMQRVQHNRVEREDDYLFFVLHFPMYHPHVDKITFGQVGVFLGRNYVITICSGRSASISTLFQTWKNHDVYTETFKKGAGYVLYLIIGALLEEIAGLADAVAVELDTLEDEVFDTSKSDAQRIGRVRQKIVRLMRLIGPKRIILQDLTEQVDSFMGADTSKYYSNNAKTARKLWEVTGEAKETVEIYKDADFTTSKTINVV